MPCAHDFYPSWQWSRCSRSSLKARRSMGGAVVEVEEAAVVREGAVAAEACRGPRAAPRDPQAPRGRQASRDRQAPRGRQASRDRQTSRDLRAALGCRDLREEEAYRVHPVAAAVSRGPHSSPPAVPRDRVVGACPPLHQSGPRAVNVHPAEGAPRSFHQAIAPAQRIDLPSLRAALRHVPEAARLSGPHKSRRVLAQQIGLKRVPEAGWPSGHRKGQWVPAQQIDLGAARPVVPRSFPPNPALAWPNALAGNPASAPARAT
jgi:hypothetical protein